MDGTATRPAPEPELEQGERTPAQPIFTIGHSTRSLEQFIDLLQAHEVTLVADVRTVPRSRHNPQFNRDTLPEALASAGIGYRHLASAGRPAPHQPRLRRTRAGATHRSAALPTTCRLPNSLQAWTNCWAWRSSGESLSCAPRPCPGAVTAR